jgi:alpha-tubulin suppressor-like RCC1 family protein
LEDGSFNVIDILAGENFSYIVKEDSTIWATGNSGYNKGILTDTN